MLQPQTSSRMDALAPTQKLRSAEFVPAHLEDVTLPRFGLVFFNHLIGEYDSFTGRAENHMEAYQKIGQLKEIYLGNKRPLTWGDLAALECLTLQLRSGPELRERFWGLQRRYREVAPKSFYPEKDLDRATIAGVDETELRARAEVLACEFFRLCMLAMCREEIRARASRQVWMTMIGFTSLYVAAVVLVEFPFATGLRELRTVSAILFAGAMGGFISAQRRIQGVTDHGESLVGIIELSSLSKIWGTLWPPLAGALFALILYAIFAGGMVTGAIFPTISPSSKVPDGVFAKLFCSECGPTASADAGKLIVWCFISGFAERFVPDALARFVSTGQAKSEKERNR